MQNNKTQAIAVNINQDEADLMNQMDAKIEGIMPLLTIRDNILLPGVVMPIFISRKFSIATLKYVEKNDCNVAVFTQKEADKEDYDVNSLMPFGTVARLLHFMEMPDGSYTALLTGMNRVKLLSTKRLPKNGLSCEVVNVPEKRPDKANIESFHMALLMLKDKMTEICHKENLPDEISKTLGLINSPILLLNNIITFLPVNSFVKHELLAIDSLNFRAIKTLQEANKVLSLINLRKDVEDKTRIEIDKQQREYFINQQIRNLQSELGGKDEMGMKEEDVEQLKVKAAKKKWTKETQEIFTRELSKLSRINLQSPDYNVQLNYLQTLVDLPWGELTDEKINLKSAQARLDKDHYGMEAVKERILEHLAVLKLRKDRKSPILCLYGPPGVGKTSLGKSIAAALKRKYVRISLGGLHDESEIRGHRRTYVGAMPGRIIKAIQKAGSANPVFILDEIDKVTQANVHGDPSSALLEVLDPEQNNAFHDNFLDIDFDLSKVMFIATANDISSIPTPLRDRMEMIEVSGYLTEEKIEIAKKHLIPKRKEENGLADHKSLKVKKDAIEFIIERYTRESGVRSLEKQIDKLWRKVALKVADGEIFENIALTIDDVKQFLGKPRFSRDIYQGNEFPGVVTGLAWTSVGGEILFIETSVSPSKGGKLTLTGNLGDVMKESAMLACEYIKSHANQWDIDPRIFDNYGLHIHVPEGAVPKDGPSAGITMATSIASALTQRKVRSQLAMTGEITLRGKVLPVGGIKEKILAAKRAGITQLMLCHENKKDIEEIPEEYLEGLQFHYVKTISDVLDYALLKEKVENAITFEIKNEEK